jgi:alkylation response protein AidB-like acyl-CoA dehydrogenase
MPAASKEIKQPKPLPAPNSDFYELAETLPAEELAVVKQVRAFMETKVAPIITKYWVEDAFPFELLPAVKDLNIGGLGMKGYGCRGGSALLFGLVSMEMARFDASIATFFGVHNGLAMGDPRSKNRSGSLRWLAGKRSAASASPSRRWVPERPAA